MLMQDTYCWALVMLGQSMVYRRAFIPNSFSLFCSQTSSHESSKTISSLSPVLLGIVWTFLSCGLLLIVFFLGFTIRCRKNR